MKIAKQELRKFNKFSHVWQKEHYKIIYLKIIICLDVFTRFDGFHYPLWYEICKLLRNLLFLTYEFLTDLC